MLVGVIVEIVPKMSLICSGHEGWCKIAAPRPLFDGGNAARGWVPLGESTRGWELSDSHCSFQSYRPSALLVCSGRLSTLPWLGMLTRQSVCRNRRATCMQSQSFYVLHTKTSSSPRARLSGRSSSLSGPQGLIVMTSLSLLQLRMQAGRATQTTYLAHCNGGGWGHKSSVYFCSVSVRRRQ